MAAVARSSGNTLVDVSGLESLSSGARALCTAPVADRGIPREVDPEISDAVSTHNRFVPIMLV